MLYIVNQKRRAVIKIENSVYIENNYGCYDICCYEDNVRTELGRFKEISRARQILLEICQCLVADGIVIYPMPLS